METQPNHVESIASIYNMTGPVKPACPDGCAACDAQLEQVARLAARALGIQPETYPAPETPRLAEGEEASVILDAILGVITPHDCTNACAGCEYELQDARYEAESALGLHDTLTTVAVIA